MERKAPKRHFLGRICATMAVPLIRPGTPITVTIRVPGIAPVSVPSFAYPRKVKPTA